MRGIFISQRKYILDLLKESCMTGPRAALSLIENNHKLRSGVGKTVDKERYQRLVGRLVYLTLDQNIAYSVSLVSEFMHDPRDPHMQAVFSHFLSSDVRFRGRSTFLLTWSLPNRSPYRHGLSWISR